MMAQAAFIVLPVTLAIRWLGRNIRHPNDQARATVRISENQALQCALRRTKLIAMNSQLCRPIACERGVLLLVGARSHETAP